MSEAKQTSRVRRASILVVALAMLAGGCSTGAKSGAKSGAKFTASEARSHPMRSARLQDAMHRFDAAVRTRVPEQTDMYDRWEGVFPAIAGAAAELARSANALAGHPPGNLELPDRGRYSVLARSLADAAQKLEDAAARGNADGVALARSEVGTACRDCHSRFRPDSPGVPDAFR